MNVQEFQEFEQHPELSVLSRLIYIFGLKRCAMESQSTTVFLNYEQIKNRVSVQQESGSIKRPQSLQIEQALYELGLTRLLQISEEQLVDGSRIHLPLMDAMLMEQLPMSLTWQPNEKLADFLKLYGVIDCDQVLDEEKQSFIAYWYARSQVRETSLIWTQKFAKHVQMNRTQRPQSSAATSFSAVGYQSRLKPRYNQTSTVDKMKRDFAPFLKKEPTNEK